MRVSRSAGVAGGDGGWHAPARVTVRGVGLGGSSAVLRP